MTTTAAKTRTEIQAEIDTLSRVEHLIETNSGTYGPGDVRRAGVAGDPQFSERNVYETVGGQRRATGPSEDRAPGRMRTINRETMAADRKRLAALKAALRSAK